MSEDGLKISYLDLPAKPEHLASLEIGSVVYLTGTIFTGREGLYERVVDQGQARAGAAGRAADPSAAHGRIRLRHDEFSDPSRRLGGAEPARPAAAAASSGGHARSTRPQSEADDA